MTPEATEAIRALTQAVEDGIAAQRTPSYVIVSYFLVPIAILVGIAVSEVLYYFRQRKQRENEKRLLAGALAAELRAFLALWTDIEPPGKPADKAGITVWGVKQTYSSFFDGSGSRLCLLGQDLLGEVSIAYFRLKRALDNLSVSQRITEPAYALDSS